MGSERWIAESDEIRQRPCLRVVEDALSLGDEMLREDVAKIDYCDLFYWIERAQQNHWKVTRFDAGGCESRDPGTLRGLIFHHMFEASAEFHVRFIFVPQECRRKGIGAHLVRWVIDKAARMPQTECKWVSLSAADDELVPWYEGFGFFDMTCGHNEGDLGQTWMEKPNVSIC